MTHLGDCYYLRFRRHDASSAAIAFIACARRVDLCGESVCAMISLTPARTRCSRATRSAAACIEAVRAMQPAGPERLLGYSFGGLVAFEMARQLLAEGKHVSFPGLRDAPLSHRGTGRTTTHAEMLTMLAEDIGLSPFALPAGSIAEILALARTAGPVPPDFPVAQAERMAAVHFNTARVAACYEPQGTLAVPAPQARAIQGAASQVDWSSLLAGAVEAHDFDCTHRGLIAADIAPVLAATIARALPAMEICSG